MGSSHQYPLLEKLPCLPVSCPAVTISTPIPIQMIKLSDPTLYWAYQRPVWPVMKRWSGLIWLSPAIWRLGDRLNWLSSRIIGWKDTSRIAKKYTTEVTEWPWNLFLCPVTLLDSHPITLLIFLNLGHILQLTPCNACFTMGQRRKIVTVLSLTRYMYI